MPFFRDSENEEYLTLFRVSEMSENLFYSLYNIIYLFPLNRGGAREKLLRISGIDPMHRFPLLVFRLIRLIPGVLSPLL